jgi:hypothetical protein
VLKNDVPRNMSGPNREETMGDWRKLHSEELYYMYSSPDTVRVTQSKRVSWVEHAAQVGEKIKTYRILVAKTEGKRPPGSRCSTKIFLWWSGVGGGLTLTL